MTRALFTLGLAWTLVACSADQPATTPGPVLPDAMITPVLDAGPIDDHVTMPIDPRDAAITEMTPILDLPLVIARPNAPLSTATIDVLAIDPDGAAVGDVAVSTGGPAVSTNRFGIARVTAVYGTDFSDVYGFDVEHTLTSARIPIRAGAASQAVLMVVPTERRELEDTAEGGTVVAEQLAVRFEPASFELPWGGMAKGRGVVLATLLAQPKEAPSVPAGMVALIEGERMPVAGVASFELRVAQGATELALVQSAVVSINGGIGALLPEEIELYYFDATISAFVPRGSLDVSAPSALVATIDRLGHWLIGSHMQPAHCVRADVQSAGTALPRAGIIASSTSTFSAARVEADAAGSGCALLPVGGDADVRALGRRSDQLIAAQGVASTSLEPAMCGDACVPSVVSGDPIELACVRGRVEIPWLEGYDTLASVSDGSSSYSVEVPANRDFCFDVSVGSQLALTDTLMTCTQTVLSSSVPANGNTLCESALDSCQDVGTITCCTLTEMCGSAGDDDCDGMVDEGCACSSIECVSFGRADQCCTAGGACGDRSSFTDECVGFEGFGIPIGCPTLEVPAAAGGTEVAQGCCRSDGQCGLMWGTLGCVAAADVPRVWGPSYTLGAVACTP